jgi:phosphomannomutase
MKNTVPDIVIFCRCSHLCAMTLIKSISGIRGTIGGDPGDGLTPLDIVKFTSAYAAWIRETSDRNGLKVVLGRDARVSGEMVEALVCGALMGMGVDVLNLGLATTPTTEIAVSMEQAQGGIILTASHNPGQWNALKLLNGRGEFISAAEGQRILDIVETGRYDYAAADSIGKVIPVTGYDRKHISRILELELVNTELIRKAGLKVVVDCVNSVGGLILPALLKSLGVAEVVERYCEPSGIFPHNPEPLPEHLGELCRAVADHGADLGLAVDPDVDRLAMIDERGQFFGEEYTIVAVSDYVLGETPGNTVSNLSSSRALKDVTEKHGCSYFASPVGEVHVVRVMKENNAVIGGEGNGGVIYPAMHYGRDALTGAALFLTFLASQGCTASELRKRYPEYTISKNRVALEPETDTALILEKVRDAYRQYPVNTEDGVKIDLPEGWIHLRKSNTEPIIRIYTEAGSRPEADALANQVKDLISGMI